MAIVVVPTESPRDVAGKSEARVWAGPISLLVRASTYLTHPVLAALAAKECSLGRQAVDCKFGGGMSRGAVKDSSAAPRLILHLLIPRIAGVLLNSNSR